MVEIGPQACKSGMALQQSLYVCLQTLERVNLRPIKTVVNVCVCDLSMFLYS